jgi:hypothetical protein
MFDGISHIVRELREILQILRDRRSGASRARIKQEVAEERAKRDADSIAYRRKLERALRSNLGMTFAELRRRFLIGDERMHSLAGKTRIRNLYAHKSSHEQQNPVRRRRGAPLTLTLSHKGRGNIGA